MWQDAERWWNGGIMMPKGISSPFVNAQCPVTTCLFTKDESLLNQSDVVVLYLQTMKNFPVNRNQNQRFVFAQLESPISHNLSHILNDDRVRYGYFNWTMTYRWDSDIVHRGEYGYIVNKSSNNGVGIRARFLNDWSNSSFSKQAESDEMMDPSFFNNVIKKKKKIAAWFVSHCSTPVQREEYVQKLIKYLPIDIFGECNNKECPYNCNEMLSAEYKFYLAFENSWCQDYVTEKLYRPLLHNAVPIVMGGAKYSRFAPPYSYINARDFDSPQKLADYILLLNRTDNLYAKYFKWKKYVDVVSVDNYGLCDLCRMAHDITLPSKIYTDIKQWWVGNEICENDTARFL